MLMTNANRFLRQLTDVGEVEENTMHILRQCPAGWFGRNWKLGVHG